MAGLGSHLGGGGAGAGHVDEQVAAGGQPLFQLGSGHGVVELPVNRELVSIGREDRAGRMLHGPNS
jgi:hypothetical protein